MSFLIDKDKGYSIIKENHPFQVMLVDASTTNDCLIGEDEYVPKSLGQAKYIITRTGKVINMHGKIIGKVGLELLDNLKEHDSDVSSLPVVMFGRKHKTVFNGRRLKLC
jgi:hypothetical protein